MAILVDEARWEWRGSRWAHFVSDATYDELHAFARQLGKRRLGFQGDHYDIDMTDRARAVALGAELVDSRDLVRRLRSAGLRDRTAKPTWRRTGSWPRGVVPEHLGPAFEAVVGSWSIDLRSFDVARFEDDLQAVLLVELEAADFETVAPVVGDLIGGPRVDGGRSIEIFIDR